MLFTKLLVPLEGTAQSAVALPLARTMARATGATLTLLRVVSAPEDEQAIVQARANIRRIAEELAASGLIVNAVVRTGDAAEEIIEQVRARDIDLIVMRTHGRAGVARAVLGSVAERVLSLSPVPLLLLRPGGRRVGQIRSMLVPVDGSPGGAVALGAAVALGQVTHASLRLLEVVVPLPNYIYGAYAFNGATYVDPAWDEEARVSAQAYVDGIGVRLRGTGMAVESEVCMAPSVGDAIANLAEERGVDLIVMSTQALIGPARAVLGSVADAVVRRAPCPVLLLRRDPPRALHHRYEGLATASLEYELIPTGS
jgi:nucleotide-binding universal stress UspA family protein